MRTMVSIRVLSIFLASTAVLAGSALAQNDPTEIGPPRMLASPLARVKPGSITRLEDLAGLPCGSGNDVGILAIAINPLSGRVEIACPRPGEFLLDVAVGGPGTIMSVTPEITCGLGAGDCAHTFADGDVVTLAATSEAGTTAFNGWGGACSGSDPTCTVTMDQAHQVTAAFLPTLTLHLGIFTSDRRFNCVFGICVYTDVFTDSRGRVTVTDLDTGLVAGVCNTDTTIVVASSQFAPPAFHITDCTFPVVPGHHLRLTAEDMTTLGGIKSFIQWGPGDCEGSTNRVCTPTDAVTVHEDSTASFN